MKWVITPENNAGISSTDSVKGCFRGCISSRPLFRHGACSPWSAPAELLPHHGSHLPGCSSSIGLLAHREKWLASDPIVRPCTWPHLVMAYLPQGFYTCCRLPPSLSIPQHSGVALQSARCMRVAGGRPSKENSQLFPQDCPPGAGQSTPLVADHPQTAVSPPQKHAYLSIKYASLPAAPVGVPQVHPVE